MQQKQNWRSMFLRSVKMNSKCGSRALVWNYLDLQGSVEQDFSFRKLRLLDPLECWSYGRNGSTFSAVNVHHQPDSELFESNHLCLLGSLSKRFIHWLSPWNTVFFLQRFWVSIWGQAQESVCLAPHVILKWVNTGLHFKIRSDWRTGI